MAKISSNLKGQLQGILQTSAGYTMGLIEGLRNKLDGRAESNAQKEINAFRKEQENFRKKMKERLKGMEEALQRANIAAEAERQKAEHHLNLLVEANREKEELHRQLIKIKEEEERWWGINRVDQPMEIAEEVPTKSPTTDTDTSAEGGGEQHPPQENSTDSGGIKGFSR